MALGEALVTAVYILNRVPTKYVSKISSKLWSGRKPSLSYFICGYPAEVKFYDSSSKKKDQKQ